MAQQTNKKKPNRAPARVRSGPPARARAHHRPEGPGTLRRIPWICLHLAVVLLPLAVPDIRWTGLTDLPWTFDGFDVLKVFLLVVLGVAGGTAWVWAALDRGGPLWRTRLDWLLLALLAWLVLTTVLSAHPQTALIGKYHRFEGLVTYLFYGLFFFLAVQEVRDLARARSLARTLCVTGFAVALYGLLQHFGIDPIDRGGQVFEVGRSFSTMGNPDLLGGYLLFPLALTAALALTEQDLRWRLVYWAGLALLVAVLITASVRGAWIGAAAALLVIAVAAVWKRIRLGLYDLLALGVAVAAGVGFVLRSLNSANEVTNVAMRLRSIFDFGAGSAQTRLEIWQTAGRAIRERPIQGWGLDTFRLVFPAFKPSEYVRDAGQLSVADNAHNYPLQMAAGIGVPGVLLLYGFFGGGLLLSLRTAFGRASGQAGLLWTGFWAACAGYLVHLMFGISVTGSSTLLWICLGVLLAPSARRELLRAPSWGRWARPAVAALAIVVLLAAGSFLAADHQYLLSQASPSSDARLAAAKGAVRLNPLLIPYRSTQADLQAEIGRQWLEQADAQTAAGQDSSGSLAKARSALEQSIQDYRAVIDFAPMEYDHYPALLIAYNVTAEMNPSYLQDAVRLAEQAEKRFPTSPSIRYYHAITAAAMNDSQSAIRLSREAARLDPNYALPLFLLGNLLHREGDLAGARDAYTRALALDPNFSDRARVEAALQSIEASLAAKAG